MSVAHPLHLMGCSCLCKASLHSRASGRASGGGQAHVCHTPEDPPEQQSVEVGSCADRASVCPSFNQTLSKVKKKTKERLRT